MVEVQTAAQKPDPLNVILKDDTTFPDPSQIDFSQLDPESMDPEALTELMMPNTVAVTAEIGPAGGELSVTSSTGVQYTYSIPAGALDDTIPFTLKPYVGLEGAPLSGGFLGAVQIDPFGYEFDEPAILTITPAPGTTTTSETVLASFAFMPDGSEFYFSGDLAEDNQVSANFVGRLASPISQEGDWVMKPWEIPQTTTAPAGIGITTRSEMRAQAKNHPPTSKKARTAQNDAAADDDLAPIIPPEYLDFGKRSQELSGWEDTLTLMDEMETKFNNAKDKEAALNSLEKAIEGIIDRIERNFRLNLNNCVSKDDFNAYYAAKNLEKPRFALSKVISARFQSKFGSSIIKDILKKAERCNLKLLVESEVTIKGVETDFRLGITSEVPLKIHYDASTGSVYYSGSGPIKHTKSGGSSFTCSATFMTQGNSSFVVNKLIPVFNPSSATLGNFKMDDYTAPGSSSKIIAKCPRITQMVPLADGQDIWGAYYFVTKFEDAGIREWSVFVPPVGGDLAKADTNKERIFPDGLIRENSTFKIKVNAP